MSMADVSTHTAAEDARNDDILIYVNGDIVHRDEAKVSVYDSGFMLGDGIWEGLRLYDGKWAFLDEHMDRLFEAAKVVDMDLGMTRAQVTEALEATRKANNMHTDVHARLMFTRAKRKSRFSIRRFLCTVLRWLLYVSTPKRPLRGLSSWLLCRIFVACL